MLHENDKPGSVNYGFILLLFNAVYDVEGKARVIDDVLLKGDNRNSRSENKGNEDEQNGDADLIGFLIYYTLNINEYTT